MVFIEKIAYKWASTVQTHVVQWSIGSILYKLVHNILYVTESLGEGTM